jgi:Tfp pilus assembly protein PilV
MTQLNPAQRRRCRPRATARGFTLVEATAAGVMLAAALVITAQLMTLSAAQTREVERRQLAGQQAANLLERLTATPWDELTAELAARQQLSADAQSRLPGVNLTVTVDAGDEQPASKRITVEIRWRNRAGEFTAPVSLSSWVFAEASG